MQLIILSTPFTSNMLFLCYSHYMSGADVTFQIYGPKKDEKKVKNILNKWIDRGSIGNITVAEKDSSIKTPLSIQVSFVLIYVLNFQLDKIKNIFILRVCSRQCFCQLTEIIKSKIPISEKLFLCSWKVSFNLLSLIYEPNQQTKVKCKWIASLNLFSVRTSTLISKGSKTFSSRTQDNQTLATTK